jgi:ATP-dependent DNA helicase RecG
VSEKRRRNVGEDNEAEKSIGEAGNEAISEAISEAENEAIKMTLRQEKILQLIREDNSLSREAISKQLKVSDSSVYRDIEKLKKIGKLERVGGNKGGYWKIK